MGRVDRQVEHLCLILCVSNVGMVAQSDVLKV